MGVHKELSSYFNAAMDETTFYQALFIAEAFPRNTVVLRLSERQRCVGRGQRFGDDLIVLRVRVIGDGWFGDGPGR